MRIETDSVCTKIIICGTFPPFKEMYTWLGRIRDRQLPAEMIIDEEGYGVILIAEKIEDNTKFSVRGWLRNEDTVYLETFINPDALVKSFHNEIVDIIEKQFEETKPSFIVGDESLNWDSLLHQANKPQAWNKRLAIYGGAEGNSLKTNLDNFSLTLEQEYLVNLKNRLRQIHRLAFYKNQNQLGKLVSFYRELAIDIALDAIDPSWYKREREKLNTKYQIDNSLKSKNIKERRKDNEKQRSLKQVRLKTLQIGQIGDGNIAGFRPYGVFVDIGGYLALLHISKISKSPLDNLEKVFQLSDWVKRNNCLSRYRKRSYWVIN